MNVLSKNIWLYRFYDFINGGDKFVVIFFIPFFMNKGFSSTEILFLPTVLCASQLIFSVPLGFLSDLWKRKYILFFSTLFRGLAWFLMYMSNDYSVMVLAWALVGLGNGFHFGSSSPFLYDTLAHHNQKEGFSKQLGYTKAMLFSFYMGISMVGGFLFELDHTIPALLNFGFCLLIAPLPLLMDEPPRYKLEKQKGLLAIITMYNEVVRVFRENPHLLLLIVYGPVIGALGQVSIFLFQHYVTELSLSAIALGWFLSIDYLIRGVVSFLAYKVLRRCGERFALYVLGGAMFMGTFIMGCELLVYLIPFYALVSLSRGVYATLYETIIQNRFSARARATMSSIKNVVYNLTYMISSGVIAWIVGIYSVSYGLLSLSLVAGGLLLIFTMVLKRRAV